MALEVQEDCFALQQRIQQLVRRLAESDLHTRPGDSTNLSDARQRLTPELGLTLFDLERGDFRYTKPAALYYPDGTQKAVRTWKEVVIAVVDWGLERGLIKDDAPMEGKRTYPLVSRSRSKLSQTHGNPDNYLSVVEGWWVDTWGNVNTKARNLIAICKDMGTDPSEFRVRLRSD